LTRPDTSPSPGPLRAASVSCDQAARIFSAVYAETFTPQQVRAIATEADLLRPDDTLNLVHYCAYIVKVLARAT
jgi:hypothetical protein